MKTQIIEANMGYRIESHGNGWAYTITRETDGASRFIQDDDARMFFDEYHDLMTDHCSPNTRASRFSWRELLDTIVGSYFD